MPAIDIKTDDSEKLMIVSLSGDLENEDELKTAIEELVAQIENHKWYSLILDITNLEMQGIQTFAMLGRLQDDKVKEAYKFLKKVAIVDNGKITDIMSAFFMKPPPNMFFDDVESAKIYLQNN
jgi:uncharacterized pyridoxal phosphate-containing UPF0001 family protein